MRNFLAFAVASRVNAIVVATGAAVSSVCLAVLLLVFPPFFFLGVVAYFMSAAVIGLAALKFGILEGLVVMLGPAVFWASPLVVAADGAPAMLLAIPLISTVLGVFVPVLLMVEVLRRTRSQALAFGTGAVLVGVVTLILHLAGFHPMQWLVRDVLPALAKAMPELNWSDMSAAGEMSKVSSAEASLGMGLYVANSLVVLILSVVVARWWHAILDNPGGFGREFREIAYGRPLAYLTVILLGVASFLEGWLADLSLKLLPTVLVLALLQGLAIAHAIAKGHKVGRHWLTGLYVLLILPFFNTLTVIAVVVVGLVDPWVRFRPRWARS